MGFDNLDLSRAVYDDFRSAFISLDFPFCPNGFVEIIFLGLEWELPQSILENGEAHISGKIPVEVQETGLS